MPSPLLVPPLLLRSLLLPLQFSSVAAHKCIPLLKIEDDDGTTETDGSCTIYASWINGEWDDVDDDVDATAVDVGDDVAAADVGGGTGTTMDFSASCNAFVNNSIASSSLPTRNASTPLLLQLITYRNRLNS